MTYRHPGKFPRAPLAPTRAVLARVVRRAKRSCCLGKDEA